MPVLTRSKPHVPLHRAPTQRRRLDPWRGAVKAIIVTFAIVAASTLSALIYRWPAWGVLGVLQVGGVLVAWWLPNRALRRELQATHAEVAMLNSAARDDDRAALAEMYDQDRSGQRPSVADAPELDANPAPTPTAGLAPDGPTEADLQAAAAAVIVADNAALAHAAGTPTDAELMAGPPAAGAEWRPRWCVQLAPEGPWCALVDDARPHPDAREVETLCGFYGDAPAPTGWCPATCEGCLAILSGAVPPPLMPDEDLALAAGALGYPPDPFAADDGPACRMCGCTQNRACDPPCSWVPDPAGEGALCSACLPFAQAALHPHAAPPAPAIPVAPAPSQCVDGEPCRYASDTSPGCPGACYLALTTGRSETTAEMATVDPLPDGPGGWLAAAGEVG